MSRLLRRRLERMEAASLDRIAPVGMAVFIPTHHTGTAEGMAELASWRKVHPGPAVICQVIDGREAS